MIALFLLAFLPTYVGPEVCEACHKDVGATQRTTAMANTWQPGSTKWLAPDFLSNLAEGPEPPVLTLIQRFASQFRYRTQLPGRSVQDVPVEAAVGGRRHGLGFLTRVTQIEGEPLPRPTLVQARYAWSFRENRLVLAPGCPEAKPLNYRTAFGLALSPAYEERCLTCHGKPHTLGAGKSGGVRCESCHGPGSEHLKVLASGSGRGGIVNPNHLNAEQSMAVCAACHVGLTHISDPDPEDLLVANQVLALKQSACYRKSATPPTCTTCHNPHQDAPEGSTTAESTCTGCHTSQTKLCPVNQTSGCIGCHMPATDVGPFHLVDHWIRVPNRPIPHDGPRLRQLVARGRQLSDAGQFAAAESVLQQAVEKYPDDANAAYHLGRVLGRENRRSEAIAAYRKAVANDGDFISAYLSLGRALASGGEIAAAIVAWEAGVNADPLTPELQRELQSAYARTGQSEKAARAGRLEAVLSAAH